MLNTIANYPEKLKIGVKYVYFPDGVSEEEYNKGWGHNLKKSHKRYIGEIFIVQDVIHNHSTNLLNPITNNEEDIITIGVLDSDNSKFAYNCKFATCCFYINEEL